ncbi:MAG TPA: hypothetical protein PLT65_01890 [Bacilli bacterium]|nr:hypothetical protein [Bacilli bacterium]
MKDKLPNIYKGSDIRSNNKKTYYSSEKVSVDRKKPSVKLQDLFASPSFIFNIRVLIKTKNENYDTKIAGKMGNNIITVDNKVIPIREIIDIELI